MNEPIFEEPNDASVQLTLENSITSRVLRREDALTDSIGQEAFEALSEYELAAMQYVFARGRVTVSELAGHLGRSVKVSRQTLRRLRTRACSRGTAPTPATRHSTMTCTGKSRSELGKSTVRVPLRTGALVRAELWRFR